MKKIIVIMAAFGMIACTGKNATNYIKKVTKK